MLFQTIKILSFSLINFTSLLLSHKILSKLLSEERDSLKDQFSLFFTLCWYCNSLFVLKNFYSIWKFSQNLNSPRKFLSLCPESKFSLFNVQTSLFSLSRILSALQNSLSSLILNFFPVSMSVPKKTSIKTFFSILKHPFKLFLIENFSPLKILFLLFMMTAPYSKTHFHKVSHYREEGKLTTKWQNFFN